MKLLEISSFGSCPGKLLRLSFVDEILAVKFGSRNLHLQKEVCIWSSQFYSICVLLYIFSSIFYILDPSKATTGQFVTDINHLGSS